jgi:two-component system nitrate/nitrite response regulator NarL
MTEEKTRIMLVDDHKLFRSGIRLLLQDENFEIVAEASDGVDAVKRALQFKPDLILLDLHLPGLAGPEVLALIHHDLPECTVLMLTVSEEGEDLEHCLQIGAAGYLLKTIEPDELITAIHRSLQGDMIISPVMTGKLVARIRERDAVPVVTAPAVQLTAREREVVAFIARGDSNKEIARELGLAESTVKIHVQNSLKKLQLVSRVQIAVWASSHGLAASPKVEPK